MIRLSVDKKTVLKIDTYEELKERPGFKESLDIRNTPLKEVIGVYTLPENVPCGISTCHTGHKKGYLAVVKDGEEICVGNVCGKKHFGTDWTDEKNAFQVISNAQRFRENIESAQYQVPLWTQRLAELTQPIDSNGSAYKNMRIQLGTGLPGPVQENLRKRAKTRDAVVKTVRRATRREKELAEETAGSIGSTNTVEDTVHIIKGISAVLDHTKLRQIETRTLQHDVEIFNTLDADSLEFDDLKYWNRWQGQMENKIAQLQLVHKECIRFLDQNNLASIRACGSAL